VPANPQEIFEALAVLMGELRAGTTDPSTARAMATVSHAMLKAHEIIMAEKQQNRELVYKDGIDPADLTDDEWVAKYQPKLIGAGSLETTDEPFRLLNEIGRK
jgi:1,2-phenylacetyl-CoA epoxidase catalytic subunit